jgi:Fic family protein
MEYLSVGQFAQKHELPERTVRNWCAAGKIQGAFLTGKTWNVPVDAELPRRGKIKEMPLLKALREERSAKLKGGIYHRTQIDLTYNSNHIEGSKLTHDQTRYIFETRTLAAEKDGNLNVDDIIETVNHFRCIDFIIDNATERLTQDMIKELHRLLKSCTSDSDRDWFNVGEYKRLPNEVGGMETCSPEMVATQIRSLLSDYNATEEKKLEDLIDFHQKFESIHPFQDGNGRVGRLILFKECLVNGIVPFIITDGLKMFYYRGLRNWPTVKEYLMDTCLTAQDSYKVLMDYFKIK